MLFRSAHHPAAEATETVALQKKCQSLEKMPTAHEHRKNTSNSGNSRLFGGLFRHPFPTNLVRISQKMRIDFAFLSKQFHQFCETRGRKWSGWKSLAEAGCTGCRCDFEPAGTGGDNRCLRQDSSSLQRHVVPEAAPSPDGRILHCRPGRRPWTRPGASRVTGTTASDCRTAGS